MKRFIKIAVWIAAGVGAVLVALFLNAIFERQADITTMSEEDKAALREQLESGEASVDGLMADAWDESESKAFLDDIWARVTTPRSLQVAGAALGGVLLIALGVRLVRYARESGQRRKKKQAEAEIDDALQKIEDDIQGKPRPPPAEEKPKKAPFWERLRKPKKPTATAADDGADAMPWETAGESDEQPAASAAPAAPAAAMSFDSYSARGKPSKKADRPAEKLRSSATDSAELPGLSLSRPATPESQREVSSTSQTAIPEVQEENAQSGIQRFRPKDLETAQRLLSKYMTRAVATHGVDISMDRTAQLVSIAEHAVRANPQLDRGGKYADKPLATRLAIRLAEEIGRQARPQQGDGKLAEAMVDVVLGLSEDPG